MINLESIPRKVQQRLIDKMRALGRTTSYSDSRKSPISQKEMHSRSTFVRMTSGQTNAVTLFGGMLKNDGTFMGGAGDIYGSRSYPKIIRDTDVMDTAGELLEDEDFGGFNEEQLFDIAAGGGRGIRGRWDATTIPNTNKRPMPGIKSIDVSFRLNLKS